jgi:hypothetical protein
MTLNTIGRFNGAIPKMAAQISTFELGKGSQVLKFDPLVFQNRGKQNKTILNQAHLSG